MASPYENNLTNRFQMLQSSDSESKFVKAKQNHFKNQVLGENGKHVRNNLDTISEAKSLSLDNT